MKYFYIYILECSDNTFYTGITNNVDRRFNEHQSGINDECYTFKRRPLKLVFSQIYYSFEEAERWEKKIKKWSQKKKRALINGNFDVLCELSVCKNKTNYKLKR
jgi:putative endonuclease